MRIRAELFGEPANARDARRLVIGALQEWGLTHLEDSAALLVSEVVTNAVLHARTGLAVEVERRGDAVRVTVSDGSPRQPQRRHHDLDSGTGRGLALRTALARDWGSADGTAPWRKDVWFELPTDPDQLSDAG